MKNVDWLLRNNKGWDFRSYNQQTILYWQIEKKITAKTKQWNKTKPDRPLAKRPGNVKLENGSPIG